MKASKPLVRSTAIALGLLGLFACASPLATDAPAPELSARTLGSTLRSGTSQLTGTGTIEQTSSTLGQLTGQITSKTAGLVNGLAKCLPLASQKSNAQIGSEGGTVSAGSYTLTIPAGSLDRPVRITIEQVSETVNSVRFGPEGLTFAKPATLRMSYSNCEANPDGATSRIVYVDEALTVLETPPSVDDRNGTVTAEIGHFSRYAVAW